MKNHEAQTQAEKRPADVMEEELLAITGGADPTLAQMQDYLTKYISDDRPLDLRTLAALEEIAQGNSYLEGVIAKGDHLKKYLPDFFAPARNRTIFGGFLHNAQNFAAIFYQKSLENSKNMRYNDMGNE